MNNKLLLLIIIVLLVPKAAGANSFNDVPLGSTHQPGIDWVADMGITRGCEPGRYCPDEPVTRAQMATFLHRMSQTATPTAGGTTIHTAEMNVIESTDGTTPPPKNIQTLGTVGPLTFEGSCWEVWGPYRPGTDDTPVPYGSNDSSFEIVGGDRIVQVSGSMFVFADNRVWLVGYLNGTDPFQVGFVDTRPMTQDCLFVWTVTEIGEA